MWMTRSSLCRSGWRRWCWLLLAGLSLWVLPLHCFPRDFSGLPCSSSSDCAGLECKNGWCGGVQPEAPGTSDASGQETSSERVGSPESIIDTANPPEKEARQEKPPEPRIQPDNPPVDAPPGAVCATKGLVQSGEAAWSFTAGTDTADLNASVRSVAVDAQNNVFVAGTFESKLILGSTTLTSQGFEDIFVAKFDAQGCVQWAFAVGGAGKDSKPELWVASNGDLVLVGRHSTPSQFRPFKPTGINGLFVARWNAKRSLLWTYFVGGMGSGGSAWLNGMAANSSGFALTGYYTDRVSYAPGKQTNLTSGKQVAYVLKLDARGKFDWFSRGQTLNEQAVSNDVAMDAQGNVSVTGEYAGKFEWFGSDGLKESATSQGLRDIFLASLDKDGKLLSLKSWGGTKDDIGQNVETYQNQVFLSAVTKGVLTFEGKAFGSDDAFQQMFVAKLSNQQALLKHQVSNVFGGNIAAYRMDISSGGTVYLSDGFSGRVKLGIKNLTAQGSFEPYLWTLDSNLGHVDAVSFPTTRNSSGGRLVTKVYAIATTPDNHVIIAGGFPRTMKVGSQTLKASKQETMDLFVVKYKP